MEENKQVESKRFDIKFFMPAIILAVISVAVALLLAVLNAFTLPVIDERLAAEKIEAIEELFGKGITVETVENTLTSPVYEMLKISDSNNQKIGYCVGVAPKGFGGKIDMLVALELDGTVKQVKILSMSETSGIGTKVQDDSFLSQFKGDTRNNTINTISGATISSKAVISGINAAIDLFNDGQEAITALETIETTEEITIGEYIEEATEATED